MFPFWIKNGLTYHRYSIFLDIPLGTERLISVTLSGIFRERIKGEHQPLRHFQRTLVIVPQGSGYLIVNDMLFITNPTNLQAKEAFVAEAKPQQPIGKIYIWLPKGAFRLAFDSTWITKKIWGHLWFIYLCKDSCNTQKNFRNI